MVFRLRQILGAGTLCLGAMAIALVIVGWHVTSASAAATEFGEPGQGAGAFEEAKGIAVDQESGDVYVVDRNNLRVDKFTPEGGFLFAWGWGVKDGAPELETCTVTCTSGSSGAGAGELTFPHGIAIDESSLEHDVYVLDTGNKRVEKYTPDGEFLLAFGKHVNSTTNGDVCLAEESCQAGEEGTEPGAFTPSLGADDIAVDSSGVVYVGDAERVQKFGPDGKLIGQLTLTGAGLVNAVAVDAVGDIYVEASALSGVHKYESCATTCVGVEVGEARDTQGEPPESIDTIAVGPSNELFVDNSVGGHRIDEFDEAGIETSSFDSGTESGASGLAYGDTIERLYAMNRSIVRLVPIPPAGPLILEGSTAAGTVGATTAAVSATVNPEGAVGATYHFEFGTSTAYGTSTATEPLAGEPFEDQDAPSALTGLEPSTAYHFRIVVTNASSESFDGPDETFTTLPPVVIESESVSQISATSAKLSAALNPLGNSTLYHFEYGPTTAYGSVEPAPDASAGSGTGVVTRSLVLEGLTPATVYHYRLVAHSLLGTTVGADRMFVTQAAQAALADGREWEQVSPPEKHGVSLESIPAEGSGIQAAGDGGALAFIAKGPITTGPSGNRSFANSQLLAVRGSGGWSTSDISTPHEAAAGLIPGVLSEYQLFSTDLSTALVSPAGATPLSPTQAPNAEKTPYIREANGTYLPLITSENVPPGTAFLGEEGSPGLISGGVVALAATPNLGDVIVESPQDLDKSQPFETLGNESLYEWSHGAAHLVSILPNKVPAAEEGRLSILGYHDNSLRGAISEDGSRVFFETLSGGETHLYVRDIERKETAQIDVPEEGVATGSGAPVFQLASADGTVVYFTDAQRLTATSRAGENEPELYRCNIEVVAAHLGCTGLKDLSTVAVGKGSGDVLGGVIASDRSGSDAYFVANGQLTAAAPRGNCESAVYLTSSLPPKGQSCALYHYDSQSNSTTLVGMLSNRDAPEWEAGKGKEDQGTTTARESSDGRYLAFMSQAPLTGFDNTDARTGQADEEVFLYDATSGALRCVSCAASGSRPEGVTDGPDFPGLLVDREKIWENQSLAGSIPGWTRVDSAHALYPSRVLFNDGRLFFSSADGLVPKDTNGKEDVYEYEPDGVGSCSDGTGCINLMSGGVGTEESAFLDSSESGDDLFFLTSAALAGTDLDQAFDVYDAHVCTTAVPCPSGAAPVSLPACSSADSCRETAPASSSVTLPSEASYGGSGNLAVTRAVVTRTRPLTRAQKLAKAMKQCKKKKRRKLRVSCERSVRRTFGRTSKVKSSSQAKRSAR
jgi:sugar lactone lactonase YvrE